MFFSDHSPLFIGLSVQEFLIYIFDSLVEDDFPVHPVRIELRDFPEDGQLVHHFLPDSLV